MTVRRPSLRDLEELSERHNLDLTEEEIDDYDTLIRGVLEAYDVLDQIPDPVQPQIAALREVGARPAPEDDPYNAIVRRCRIKALEPTGDALAGKTIGVKDTISVAGVPMTCASRLLYDYTADSDATIVTRMLDAGGEITHVLNTDDFGFSGVGHTSIYGPTYNPNDPAHHASHHPGGSSAGSAIAVKTDMVDLALGGDQGGSIRIPAAWSGIVGLKPSHGLVPYSGIVGIDNSIDHIGPMTRSVAECALLLSVIAGKAPDAIDPRQPDEVVVQDYQAALSGGAKGLKIAVVEEGFGHEDASEPEVDEAVRAAAGRFEQLGATVTNVTIPYHRLGLPIWTGVVIEGAVDNFERGGFAYQNKGHYNPRFMTHLKRAARTNGGDFSPTSKMGLLVGHYLREQYHGAFYGRAQNMARVLTEHYDRALAEHDILLMPTTPQRAIGSLPSVQEDRVTYCAEALGMVQNTAPINISGHPSISVPCRDVDGLPIGVMLTGRWMDDATVLRAAEAYMNG